jgi:hypothetical protein
MWIREAGTTGTLKTCYPLWVRIPPWPPFSDFVDSSTNGGSGVNTPPGSDPSVKGVRKNEVSVPLVNNERNATVMQLEDILGSELRS